MELDELLSLIKGGGSELTPIGAASSAIQGIAGIVGNIQAKKRYNRAEEAFKSVMNSRPAFQISPEIKQQLAMQQAQYGAEDASIKQAKAAQEQALSNYMGNAQRNASSGTQALSSAGEVANMGMQNAARLAGQQFENQMAKGQALAAAQGAMAQQRAMQFQDALSANQEKQAFNLGQMQAERTNINESNKNIFNAIPGMVGGLGMAYGAYQKEAARRRKPGYKYSHGSDQYRINADQDMWGVYT